ncbi:hypothetical protein N431DRAFT_306260, partial [Stipitochalara longipes BDJ]
SLPSDTCYLLKLPREIRFIIYRLLLIPQSSHYFLDPEIPNHASFVESWRTDIQKVQTPLHTAIFRTNRHINAEATSLLYRELTLIICPTDIAVLRDISGQSLDVVQPLESSYNVWRYDPRCFPLIQFATSMSPEPLYTTQQLRGKMYPHIFAGFCNVVLNLSLTFPAPDFASLSAKFEGFTIDLSGHIPPSELKSLASDICSMTLIHDFVTLLSHSPSLSILWITLDTSASGIQMGLLRDDERDRILCKVVNMKAAEICLECGVLDPLKELRNVECAILNVRCPTEDCFATLQPKYAAIAEKLEEEIEFGGPVD